jgi:hypothetical protein
MLVLDVATARANIAAMLVYLDEDAAREAFRHLRAANKIASQLSARLAALECDGLDRSAKVDALVADPLALTLCASLFSIVTIGANGWQLAPVGSIPNGAPAL